LKRYGENSQLLSQENRGKKSSGRPRKYSLDELKFNIATFCDYFKISKSSFYRWIKHGRPFHKS
jgi:hypothetical protein